MSATLLSGTIVRDALIPSLISKIKSLSHVPKLAIIQVGDRPDSTSYIKAKQAFAKKIGVETRLIHFIENISQDELIEVIQNNNNDQSVCGIIVQLPLPPHINRSIIIEAINPSKDIDGLTSVNYSKLLVGDHSAIVPATARGVRELIEHYHLVLSGKKVAVVGRSRLVGTPVAIFCKNAGADVIVCHSKTPDLVHETRQADIVIVAVGKPGLIGANHLKVGAIVIDIGISKMSDGSLKGDVDYDSVKDIVSAISPVPGGVGPMTVLALFENLVDSCK